MIFLSEPCQPLAKSRIFAQNFHCFGYFFASLCSVLESRNSFAAVGQIIAVRLFGFERCDPKPFLLVELIDGCALFEYFDGEIVDAMLFDGAIDVEIFFQVLHHSFAERSLRLTDIALAVDGVSDQIDHHRLVEKVPAHDFVALLFVDKIAAKP